MAARSIYRPTSSNFLAPLLPTTSCNWAHWVPQRLFYFAETAAEFDDFIMASGFPAASLVIPVIPQRRGKSSQAGHGQQNCQALAGHMGMGQNPVPLVNIKIAGKWKFIPLKMVLIGIDPYPYSNPSFFYSRRVWQTSK